MDTTANTTANGRKRYDVVVVGGGAAGLSGALALSRARRSVLVVDAGTPRNAPAGHVHNYLGREGTPPLELLAIGREEVASYGGEVVLYDRDKEDREAIGKRLATERGLTLIPPYDHPHIIAGQGTATRELIEVCQAVLATRRTA